MVSRCAATDWSNDAWPLISSINEQDRTSRAPTAPARAEYKVNRFYLVADRGRASTEFTATLPAGVEPDDGVSATSGINMALVISLPIGPKTRLIAFSILR